ncbi:MAG: leucine-rich repeat protein [Oscillospiraceae bacterium]
MKKLLALLMAVAVTFQLVTPVFADTEGTEETTAPTEAVVETKAPTEAPAEETTAPTEETTAPTEETSAPTEATEETEEATEVTEETVEDIALFAEDGDVIASGECGRYSSDDLTWVLTGDGTLTISGSGEMAYYSMDNSRRTTAPWVAYWEQITAIVLEPGVTSVGGTAFSACSNVLSVSIPSTVTYIDSSAFEECENMTNITFGHKFDDSLRIDESSFDSAYRLARTIRVPSARRINKAIETYRWDRSCRSINYVSTENIPMEGITIENSESTASVELGTQVELQVSLNPIDTTDDYTWTVVSEKTTADARISKDGVLTTLSTGTVTVRVQCAQNPAVFDEIVVTILPPTGALTSLAVTTLNDYPGDAELGKPVQMIPVFTPANAAERSVSWSLENGTGTATIDNNGLLTPLTTGTVMVYATTPSGIEGGCTVNIVRYAEEITILLNGKEGLSRFAAGEGAELSFRLFPEDTTTKEVEWEVTNGTGAAKLCIDSDHEYAKLECQKAGSVMLTATAKDSKQVVATKELTITDTVCTYALPDGSGNLYYNAETGWITGADETVKNVLIPAKIDGVTIVGIDPYVFANRSDYWGYVNDNTTLTSVSIPNTMEEIGENAFKQCTALSTLRFAPGSKLKTIGEYAFQGCSSITSLTIPDGLKNIGDGAFCGLKNLKYLTMSGEVDGSGWIDWWSIDTLTLTGTYVMGRAPADKDGYIWYDTLPGRNARKVILSEGITSIDDYAFNRCQNLEQLVLPTSLQTIGAHAFEFCENLTDITIPDSLQTLGQDCFKECNKLQLIDMSKVPDTFIERETYLTGMVTFPDWLVRATKGKAEIGWDLYQTDTGYETIGSNCAYVYQDWGNRWLLEAYKSGKCYIVCQDTYTGIRGSKEIEVKTGIVIRPADTGYLVSGGKLALSAWNMPAESRVDVDWSLAPGSEEYASINDRGNLTAKTVYAAQQITVIAQPYDDGERVTKNIWILPKTTGLGLMLDGAPLGSTLNVDQAQTKTLQLSAKVYPDGALQEMQWTSTASGVARVDEDGLVTLVKPGVTVIKAATKDGSRLTAQVTLNVTYVDSAGKLTLTAGEMPEIGLQPGQKVRLTLRGEQAIPYESVVFSVPSNQSAMGSVDENGLFTAGTLTGRVDVTAALKDDPLGRTASISIQVIPVQAAELALTAELPEENLLDGTVIFDRTELNRDVIFPVTAKAFDRQGVEVVKDILWSSSDTSIAKVDFEGNVTVKAGANGYCTITATAQDLAMASATILISVRDYAPRLDASTLSLNTASTAGVDVALVESYGNAIEKVTVDDARFHVSYENNLLTLSAREAVARGNYAMTLEAICGNGRTYTYPITVRASQTLPRLAVRQSQRFNLFYRDSQATLTITGGEVESAELTGNSDFVLENEDGEWVIRYADPENAPAKPSTRATLSVSFAGYNTPVTRALTIGTVNTAPKLKLNPTSSTLNTALNSDWSVETVLSGADGESLYAYTDTPGVDVALSGNVLTLTLTETKNVSANVYVQDDNWTKPVKLTHRVTVTNRLPTLRAAAGTLKLNSWFPSETASTGMILSQGNVSLTDVELTPAAREGTAARAESDKLNVYYDAESGEIVAEIADPGIKNGTYSFACTGVLESGTEISGGTVRVTVSNTLPRARLSAAMVRLNRQLAGEESIAVKVTLTGGDGYAIEGFEELPDCLDYADGILTATIPNADFTGGSYVLNAIVSRNGETATLPAGVILRVQVYDRAPSFRLTAKGKLDVLNPASEIVYTPRLTNAQGTVTDIRLEGADAELFAAEVVDGVVHLTMAKGCTYSTRTTYKVIPVLTFCGQEVTGSTLSIRVTQSTVRLAKLSNRTVYQSQTAPLVQVLSITSPATAEFGEITLNSRSTAALRNAVEAAGGIEVSGGIVRFPAKAFASLKPGRYTVILDVTPENAAADAKPIQARFTLTVQK